MGLKERIGRQCRKPTGTFGKIVARKMNKSHDEVTRWGIQFLDTGRGKDLLDVGCGGGRNLRNLAEKCPDARVVGVDHSRDMVALSRQVNMDLLNEGRIEVVEATVSRLPFEDGSFDAVTAVETYFFWPDLINDLREVMRVTRPGGMVLLVTEAYHHPDFEERNRTWEQMSDFKTDTPEELRGYLESAGLEDIESTKVEENNWLTAWGRRPF